MAATLFNPGKILLLAATVGAEDCGTTGAEGWTGITDCVGISLGGLDWDPTGA